MNLFHKTEQHLLRKYPNIWNTKLLWFTLIGLVAHSFFFLMGYGVFSSPTALHKGGIEYHFFSSGFFLIHLITSIIILVWWMTLMFKNNAFKSFYPLSTTKLWGQFIQYFAIIFINSSFYLSFWGGAKSVVELKYSDDSLQQNIELFNTAMAFVPTEPEQYNLNNRQYPEVFAQSFCETRHFHIDTNQPYFVFKDRAYQFYNQEKVISKYFDNETQEYLLPNGYNKADIVHSNIYDDHAVFWIKKDLAKLDDNTIRPYSIYNYSHIFYTIPPKYEEVTNYISHGAIAYPMDYQEEDNTPKILLNKKLITLLDQKDKSKIENTINNFLTLSKKWQIKHNVTTQDLMDYCYNPNFIPQKFIKTHHINDYYYQDIDEVIETIKDEHQIKIIQQVNKDYTPEDNLSSYHKKNLVHQYYDKYQLESMLENINDVKTSLIHHPLGVFLSITLGLSLFVYLLRTSSLRLFIFSIITSGVISLILGFFVLILTFSGNIFPELAIPLLYSITYLIVMLIPYTKIFGKSISAICINMALSSFPLFLLSSLMFVEELVQIYMRNKYYHIEDYTNHYFSIMEWLGGYFPTILLITTTTMLFVYLYSRLVRQNHAREE